MKKIFVDMFDLIKLSRFFLVGDMKFIVIINEKFIW